MNQDLMRESSKPRTVAEYIAAAPKDARKRLREMRACLRKAAPGATEALKWNAPSFSYQRILFSYAAFTRHISLFPTPAVLRVFAAELKDFKTSGSTIQFPLDKSLPLALIRKLALQRVRDCREKDARWM